MSGDDEDTQTTDFPHSITPHIGTEVSDDKFFPRKELAEQFDSAMMRTNGAKLFGLRRIGKSSEAVACCERLSAAGFIVIREDAQGMATEVDLLLAILRKLPTNGLYEKVLQLVSDNNAIAKTVRDMIAKASAGKADDMLAYISPIMAAVEQAIDKNEHVVLVIDEFPWLCRSILQSDETKGAARVDLLLASLRRWRNQGMRMMLMGSIGMVALGRQYHLDLSHMNDLNPLNMPPFEADEAKALVDALAVGGNIHNWTPVHTAALLEETVAFYPAILQKGFEQITIGGKAVSVERFADLFADKVRPDFDDTYYQQFDKRLKFYRDLPDPLPALLNDVLLAVMKSDGAIGRNAVYDALSPNGEVSDADLGDALNILREDGFLAVRTPRDGNQQWRPASDLMRAWWQQRRGSRR